MSNDAVGPTDAGAAPGFESDRAATFAVLSRCWRLPDGSLVDAVNDGALEPVVPGVRDVDLDELRAEYSRLLLGPGDDQIPPYESVYRDREADQAVGPVHGPSTKAVVKWYRSHGVAPDDDASELPDHLATELEFLAYLADSGHHEDCEQFLDEHPRRWVDEFLAAVRERARHPFYEALAATTADVLAEA